MKALICGGRLYSDHQAMGKALSAIQAARGAFDEVIHGAAKGADVMSGDWATAFGIPVRCFPAQWGKHGKAAGPIRNQQMLDECHPDLVIAFPVTDLHSSPGTRDMVTKAHIARVPIIVVSGPTPIYLTVDGHVQPL